MRRTIAGECRVRTGLSRRVWCRRPAASAAEWGLNRATSTTVEVRISSSFSRTVLQHCTIQGGPNKRGHKLMAIILSNLNDFYNFLTGRFLGKFAVSHTTLWNSNVRKQAISDTLQGSVAIYLRWSGIVNKQIKKRLLLSLSVKKIKIGEYFVNLQARTWLSRALCASGHHAAKDEESARDNHVLARNFAKYSPISIFFHWQQ